MIDEAEETIAAAAGDAPTLTWEQARAAVQAWAIKQGDFSGYPMPIEDHRIQMAPRHRRAANLQGFRLGQSEDGLAYQARVSEMFGGTIEEEGIENNPRERIRNEFWSKRLRSTVTIMQTGEPGDPDYKVEALYYTRAPQWEHLLRWRMQMETLDVASSAWDPGAELQALETLRSHVTKQQWGLYVTTGWLPEQSKRSQCCYIFRRARPTVVLHLTDRNTFAPKVALCMHPLAYYQNTYAGGMVPTDDLMAHLLLMRADEKLYWRRCTQHPIDSVPAGL